MTNVYCKNCPIIGTDCGPWDDDSDCFKNIKSFHKGHPGFQIGEPILKGKPNWGHSNIEKEATKVLFDNGDEWLHNLIAFYKGSEKACMIKDKWKLESQT